MGCVGRDITIYRSLSALMVLWRKLIDGIVKSHKMTCQKAEGVSVISCLCGVQCSMTASGYLSLLICFWSQSLDHMPLVNFVSRRLQPQMAGLLFSKSTLACGSSIFFTTKYETFLLIKVKEEVNPNFIWCLSKYPIVHKMGVKSVQCNSIL